MKMKKTLVLLLALACLGCSAAAKQTYRTNTNPPVDWQIEGVQSAFGRLRVRINGTDVMDGSISIWSGKGEMTGTYEGRQLAAKCEKGSGGGARSRCLLTIDGAKMTILHFRPI